MKDHELKCWPASFRPIMDGFKTADLRKNDRAYAIGDTLTLREWDQHSGLYTGRFVRMKVRHVADVSPWVPGYVLLSIESLG